MAINAGGEILMSLQPSSFLGALKYTQMNQGHALSSGLSGRETHMCEIRRGCLKTKALPGPCCHIVEGCLTDAVGAQCT